VPLWVAGGGVIMAGVIRFAALRRDPLSGQEFAAVLAVAALALVVLGTSWLGARGGRR